MRELGDGCCVAGGVPRRHSEETKEAVEERKRGDGEHAAYVEDVSLGTSAGMIEEGTASMQHVRNPANNRYERESNYGILC